MRSARAHAHIPCPALTHRSCSIFPPSPSASTILCFPRLNHLILDSMHHLHLAPCVLGCCARIDAPGSGTCARKGRRLPAAAQAPGQCECPNTGVVTPSDGGLSGAQMRGPRLEPLPVPCRFPPRQGTAEVAVTGHTPRNRRASKPPPSIGISAACIRPAVRPNPRNTELSHKMARPAAGWAALLLVLLAAGGGGALG